MAPRDPDFVAICAAAKQEIEEITLADLTTAVNDGQAPLIIDVREDSEWDRGHMPDAIHIGKGVIERDIAKHAASKDTPMALYCGGGSRSALAALNLKKMGYTQVLSLIGGYRGYAAEQE